MVEHLIHTLSSLGAVNRNIFVSSQRSALRDSVYISNLGRAIGRDDQVFETQLLCERIVEELPNRRLFKAGDRRRGDVSCHCGGKDEEDGRETHVDVKKKI